MVIPLGLSVFPTVRALVVSVSTASWTKCVTPSVIVAPSLLRTLVIKLSLVVAVSKAFTLLSSASVVDALDSTLASSSCIAPARRAVNLA